MYWLVIAGSCSPIAVIQAQSHRSHVVADWQKKRFDTQSGLPHNTVTAISVDILGYVWIGTSDGIVRYNGYDMRPFAPRNGAWRSSFIKSLFSDDDGRMWIGTESGVYVVDAVTLLVVPINLPSGVEPIVQTISADSYGVVYVSMKGGVLRCELDSCLPETVGDENGDLVDDHINQFQKTAGGLIYGTTYSRRLAIRDPITSSWSVVSVGSQVGELDLVTDSDGTLYAYRRDAFIARFNLSADSLPMRQNGYEQPNYNTIMLNSALYYTSNEHPNLERVYLEQDTTAALRNTVRSLHCTDQHCWVGTLSGLYMLKLARNPFNSLDRSSLGRMGRTGYPAVSAIATFGDDIVIGTFGSGLFRIRQSGEMETIQPAGASRATMVWSLSSDHDSTLWIGSENGLFRLVSGTAGYESVPNPVEGQSLSVQHTGVINDSTLLVGTFQGTYFYNTVRNRWVGKLDVMNGASARYFTQGIAPAKTGGWWLGLFSGEILHLSDPEQLATIHPSATQITIKSSEGYWSLYEDDHSNIWTGSDAGLMVVTCDGTVKHFRQEDGLIGNIAYAIVPDNLGRIWVTTNRGLSSFTPGQGCIQHPHFRNFDGSHGVPIQEFNRRASMVNNDGVVYLGGMEGLMWFNPADLNQSKTIPKVYIHHTELRGMSGNRFLDAGSISTVTMKSDENSITLGYGAVLYEGAEHVRYRYRMSDVDFDTIDAHQSRMASYTNLAPGTYQFEVWSTGSDGSWNPIPASVRIEVQPAYWQTVWFQMLVLIAFTALVWTIYQTRVRRLLAVERIRLRIAADLHDQIGSGLSSLAMMSEQLKLGVPDKNARFDMLAEISSSARGMAQELREIVWYTNPLYDRLDRMVDRMRDLPYQLVPQSTLELLFDHVPSTPVPPDFRRDFMLSYREVLHNISKHAVASKVEVRLSIEQRMLHLQIVDNGIGFDTDSPSDGMGLRSIKDRVTRLAGEVKWTSSMKMGTIVDIRVPLP